MKLRLHFSFAHLYLKKFLLQCSRTTLRTVSETNRCFVKVGQRTNCRNGHQHRFAEELGQLRTNNYG